MAELAHAQRALTDEEYTAFERIFRGQIPPSFKAHYMADNGGSPTEQDVESGQWGLPVHGFNPIKYGKLTIERLVKDIDRIEATDTSFGSWEKFSFVPFAYDAGGNTIFLSLRNDDYGEVYIYAPDGGNIKNISPSFEEFRARYINPEVVRLVAHRTDRASAAASGRQVARVRQSRMQLLHAQFFVDFPRAGIRQRRPNSRSMSASFSST